MKNKLLTAIALLTCMLGVSQTATDFTATDCGGTSHTLFNELNSGKVIVICWVMPCHACIAGASNSSKAVQSFASSNPDQVKFYLVDDKGNSTCKDVSDWASTNNITYNAVFGNAGNIIKMTDYGTAGMPKIVVIGKSGHTVHYNVNGSGTVTAIQTAIKNALNVTSITEKEETISLASIFPNPAVTTTKVAYTLKQSSAVTLKVINELGQEVNQSYLGNQSAGRQEYQLNIESLKAGSYFIQLYADKAFETLKFTITR
jgi:hypothetical protein